MTASAEPLRGRTLSSFAALLASAAPTPGPGSAAALQAALGASLAAKVLRREPDEESRDRAPYLEGRAEELDGLRERALELVDEDARAYAELAAGGAEPGKAMETLLEILELAVGALRICAAGVEDAASAMRSDAAAAADILESAARGASYMLEANEPEAELLSIATAITTEVEVLAAEVRRQRFAG